MTTKLLPDMAIISKRSKMRSLFCVLAVLVVMAGLVSACAKSPSAQTGGTATPSRTPYPTAWFRSSGTGEPRSPGYWLIWNTCAENNQSETARTNGGREAGWILLDDLLTDPGMLIGSLEVATCEQGVNLLQGRDLQGVNRQNDAAYTLSTQLLTAQLNLSTGSEFCPASDQAVNDAQTLLMEMNFNGSGGYLGPPLASEDIEKARDLTEQLVRYNNGTLCLP